MILSNQVFSLSFAQGFSDSQKIVRRGGRVAGVALQTLEAETGRPVITTKNAADFRQLITDIVEDSAALPENTEQNGNDGKKGDGILRYIV